MWDNMGSRVKVLAKIMCWLGIIASIVYAIVLWSQNSRYNDTTVFGLAVLFGGSLASWLSSWVMYTIGDTNEKTSEMYDMMQQNGRNIYSANASGTDPQQISAPARNESAILNNEEAAALPIVSAVLSRNYQTADDLLKAWNEADFPKNGKFAEAAFIIENDNIPVNYIIHKLKKLFGVGV